MASNINPYNIDGTFPVAGQDNSSQGFRDNFTNIKNNFAFAQNEINDLQSKTILTSALAGQTISNDMAGVQIVRPQLRAWTEAYVDLGRPSTTSVELNFLEGNFQKVQPISDITLSISNWPIGTGSGATGYGVLRVWLIIDNNPATGKPYRVTFPDTTTIGLDDVAGYNNDQGWIEFDVPGNYVFDFSSADTFTQGQPGNFIVFDVTRNHSTFHDPDLYFNNSVTPTMFIGWGPRAIDVARGYDTNQNTLSLRGSAVSTFVGNLTKANLTTGRVDGQPTAGFTVTSLRGNIDSAIPVFTPVQSGDYLGYVNAVTYSGYQGNANTFQQTASMAFFATGSNVTYGLGGNIAFFTSPDGEPSQHGVTQCLGIENDQSVKFYGNVILNNIDASNNVSTLALNGQVNFANFSGEILINDITSGYMYKFLVGSGNVWLLGTTNANWTPTLVAPTTSFTLASWVKMEFVSGLYRFTNLASSRNYSFYTVKTRNGA